jgi:hypothetical protein
MARPSALDPWNLLKNADSARLADFLEYFDEGIAAAFIDSHRKVPARRHERPGVYARGTYRRWQLDESFRRSAQKAGMVITTGTNSPPTWSFPILRTGAFSITLGIVDRHLAQGPRRLRCKGAYMRRHAARNGVMDPQGSLGFTREKVTTILPNGAIGAVIVVEGSVHQPDRPRYVGFWIPSPSLVKPFFRAKIEDVVLSLRRYAAAAAPRKPAPGERIKPVRKMPVRKTPRRKDDDGK